MCNYKGTRQSYQDLPSSSHPNPIQSTRHSNNGVQWVLWAYWTKTIGFLGFLVVFWWFLVKKPWLLTMVSNHGYSHMVMSFVIIPIWFLNFVLTRLAGALPPHSRTVDLKVSEMSAFGPPRCCASGSLGNNIINRWFLTKLQLSVFGPKVEAWVIDFTDG